MRRGNDRAEEPGRRHRLRPEEVVDERLHGAPASSNAAATRNARGEVAVVWKLSVSVISPASKGVATSAVTGSPQRSSSR